MICPFCARDDDKVIDSRSADGGSAIRRRRVCNNCDRRFTTYERVEKTARLMVVKKDGSRVSFDSSNVLRGLQAACGKRPISEDAKHEIAAQIEEEVHRDFDREISSREIGLRVIQRLRDIDQIAYIRYASEYHNFETLSELEQELDDLKNRPRNLPNQTELFEK